MTEVLERTGAETRAARREGREALKSALGRTGTVAAVDLAQYDALLGTEEVGDGGQGRAVRRGPADDVR